METRPGGTGGREAKTGGLLAELATLDEQMSERDAAWRQLVRRLDTLRREIAVAGTQVQSSRALAAREATRADDHEIKPAAPPREEARFARLTEDLDAALRATEEGRVALHAQMDALRGRRQDLLRRLPVPLARAYQSLADAGCKPAIAGIANGVCGGCEAPLPEVVVEALGQGAVVVCARCERLLHLAGQIE
jgi:predicted  nucleic acid-binding Zn-ribbon protein